MWLSLFVVCAIFTAVATHFVRSYALRNQILDVASERSSHSGSVPRGGGIAIVAAVLAGLVFATLVGKIPFLVSFTIGIPAGLIALVGWIDDRRGLSAALRAGVHLACSVVLVFGLRATAVTGGSGLSFDSLSPLALFGLVIACAWSINFYNFMDGIDGLAAGQGFLTSVAASAALAVAAPQGTLLLALLGGSCLGFLWQNRPPARIFMGDIGSGFLGFMFAAVCLLQTSESATSWAIIPVILAGFIADTGITLGRRVIRGDKWHQPHRSHGYQRLARRLGCHARATVTYCLLSMVVGVPAILVGHSPKHNALVALLACFAIWSAFVLYLGAGEKEMPTSKT